MKSQGGARRYGVALFQAAKGKGITQRIYFDFQELLLKLESQPDFWNRFKSQSIGKDVKKFLLKDLTENKLHPLSTRFFELVIERKREGMLRQIFDVYENLLDTLEGRMRARVVSAAPLKQEERKALGVSLSSHFQKEVILKEEVDPRKLGGFDIHVEGFVLRNSIQARLAQLERTLTAA